MKDTKEQALLKLLIYYSMVIISFDTLAAVFLPADLFMSLVREERQPMRKTSDLKNRKNCAIHCRNLCCRIPLIIN
jgi:hypothetical protein